LPDHLLGKMMRTQNTCRLRIYSDDSDSFEGRPFYEWLVEQAHHHGMRGATVVRGTMGFGGHGEIHSSKLFALAADLPVVVEIIDSRKKIADFVALFDGVLHQGMATIEDIDAIFFGEPS
jgi:PII-like signaling protein